MDLISKTIFVYNSNNADSLEIAQKYQDVYGLDNSQLIGVNCSSNEILNNYSDFQTEVENDVYNEIVNNGAGVVILGYEVPGGYYSDSGDIIAATSKINGLLISNDSKFLNPFYNRQLYAIFTEADFDRMIICSRIDAPTKEIALNMIDYDKNYYNQYFINGIFFFDPYLDFGDFSSNSSSFSNYNQYKNDLLYFKNGLLQDLNFEVASTVDFGENSDAVFRYLKRDSFYWGWITDRARQSFFKNTNTARIFFYNADYDSAFTVRDTSYDVFAPLVATAGYVGFAGAMSNPTLDGFLRPEPFFRSLKIGGTIGEAFVFSSPYINWTISLFGDPLAKVHII